MTASKLDIPNVPPSEMFEDFDRLLARYLLNSVPVLYVNPRHLEFSPVRAFRPIIANYSRYHFTSTLAEPSGSLWFTLFLDAVGTEWPVRFATFDGDTAVIAVPGHRFYWQIGDQGLSDYVLRPLFLDWMLRDALWESFGGCCDEILQEHPLILEQWHWYKTDFEQFIAGVQDIPTLKTAKARKHMMYRIHVAVSGWFLQTSVFDK